MPSGYTAPVADGTITEFADFALECARGFVALMHLRDLPKADIPERIEVEPYYATRLAEALANRKSVEARVAAVAKNTVTRERYEDMIRSAAAWTPPTEQHEGLKSFMLDQLRDSLKFDVSDSMPWLDAKPFDDWRERALAEASRKVVRARDEFTEAKARAEGATEWLRALRASLGLAVTA